jgi:small-conductance mechanosensitive channel
MKKEDILNYIILVCGVIIVVTMIFRYLNGMNVPFVGLLGIVGLFFIVWGQWSKSKKN